MLRRSAKVHSVTLSPYPFSRDAGYWLHVLAKEEGSLLALCAKIPGKWLLLGAPQKANLPYCVNDVTRAFPCLFRVRTIHRAQSESLVKLLSSDSNTSSDCIVSLPQEHFIRLTPTLLHCYYEVTTIIIALLLNPSPDASSPHTRTTGPSEEGEDFRTTDI